MTQDEASSLLVSFPDQTPNFVNGFEAGQLWERMRSGKEAEIEVTTHTENREVIARMADQYGFALEVEESDIDGWDNTILSKKRPQRTTPNPHGLRLVAESKDGDQQ